uniref:Si:dkeyp-75b4.9 n=1 Tax=Sinocyclocheilus grahami TaxID=75366 RepID=A0A672L6Z7_SINGR
MLIVQLLNTLFLLGNHSILPYYIFCNDRDHSINIFKPSNSEVGTLRILLHGPQGAGKSSFFNSVYNVLQGRITTRALAHAVETGQSFTVKVKDRGIKMDDIIKLLNGHINSGYNFNPLKPITEEDPKYNKNPTLKDRIHCLVAVLPANTVSMMDDTNLPIIKQMSDVRKEARNLGIPQVIILTKVDESCQLVKDDLKRIYTSKKIKQKVLCFKFLTMVNIIIKFGIVLQFLVLT